MYKDPSIRPPCRSYSQWWAIRGSSRSRNPSQPHLRARGLRWFNDSISQPRGHPTWLDNLGKRVEIEGVADFSWSVSQGPTRNGKWRGTIGPGRRSRTCKPKFFPSISWQRGGRPQAFYQQLHIPIPSQVFFSHAIARNHLIPHLPKPQSSIGGTSQQSSSYPAQGFIKEESPVILSSQRREKA